MFSFYLCPKNRICKNINNYTDSTCEASCMKTVSKLNIFGAVAAAERALAGGSQKVSCFLWASTFRKDMDSEVSRDPLAGHIRTITLTCGTKNYIYYLSTDCENLSTIRVEEIAKDSPHTVSTWKACKSAFCFNMGENMSRLLDFPNLSSSGWKMIQVTSKQQ